MTSEGGHAARLGAVASHVAAANTQQVEAEPAPLRLLSDADVATFLAQGYLAVHVDDLPETQAALCDEALTNVPERGGRGGGWLGNNCLPLLPRLRTVFTSGAVAGALKSLLGEDYAINNHRHMHHSSVSSEQSMHKDEQRWPAEHHRLRSVIIFYVPGGCTLEMGPTAIVPGAHLLSRDNGEWGALADEINANGTAATLAPSLSEIKLTAPKGQGTAVLLHHSMFHRGTARLVDEAGEPLDDMVRPMFKFIFTRCHEPTAPDWNSSGDSAPDWESLTTEPSSEHAKQSPHLASREISERLLIITVAPVLQSLLEWQMGAGNAPLQDSCDVPAALAQLLAPYAEGDDAERTGAAYALARAARSGDEEALPALLTALSQREYPAGRRCAAHALTAAGPSAVAPLLTALAEGVAACDFELAVDAADALGEAGGGAGSIALIETLSTIAKELHQDVIRGTKEEWEKIALAPGHNRWATGPDAAVGSLVLAMDHLAMRAVAGVVARSGEVHGAACDTLETRMECERVAAKVCEGVLPFIREDDAYQHQYTHARAPVLAAEAIGNLALVSAQAINTTS